MNTSTTRIVNKQETTTCSRNRFSVRKALNRTLVALSLACFAMPGSVMADAAIGDVSAAPHSDGCRVFSGDVGEALRPILELEIKAELDNQIFGEGSKYIKTGEINRRTGFKWDGCTMTITQPIRRARFGWVRILPNREWKIAGEVDVRFHTLTEETDVLDLLINRTHAEVCIVNPRVVRLNVGLGSRWIQNTINDSSMPDEICTRLEDVPNQCTRAASEAFGPRSETLAATFCEGSPRTTESVECYEHFAPSLGSGALWLCQGSTDFDRTRECYSAARLTGASRGRAIESCMGENSPICRESVQGKIAWNYRGSNNWSSANVDFLCSGANASSEPARCFNAVMHGHDESIPGGINTGSHRPSGNRWRWQDASNLCAGSTDAMETVSCWERSLVDDPSMSDVLESCRS